MVSTNETVKKFYTERKAKKVKMFGEPKFKVSIHDVIRQNDGETWKERRTDSIKANDLGLLKSVRERGADIFVYLSQFKLDYGHKRRFYNFVKWRERMDKNRRKAND